MPMHACMHVRGRAHACTVKREGPVMITSVAHSIHATLIAPPTTNYNCSVGVVSMSSSTHTNVKYATPTLQL